LVNKEMIQEKRIMHVNTTEECEMAQIMTTKELAKYLKLHEITVCKYASEGRIPSIRIGRVWRFDKEAIDKWISGQD
jgi:excisionase family DNA binding protein